MQTRAQAGKAWLSQIDARIKIIALISIIILLFWLPLKFAVVFFLAAIALMITNRIGVLAYLRNNLMLALACLIPFILRLFFQQGYADLAGFMVPLGLLEGAQNTLYLISILLFANLLIETSTTLEIKNALAGLGMPKRYATMLSISFGFRRYIDEKSRRARVAQAARGVRNNPISQLVPTLNSSFARSKTLALSLVSRGFVED